MIVRPLPVVFALALACQPALAKDKAQAPADLATVTCAGVFGPDSSEALVKETFGAENVETGIVDGPEGSEILATTVYPDDPERSMRFGWWDEDNLSYLSYVALAPNQTTPQGVRIGMSVAEVEAINGAPFTIGGFWWDYGGTAMFETGAMADRQDGCGFWLRFSPLEDAPEGLDVSAIAGDVTVPSDEPLLQRLDTRVSTISLGYPWPEHLPQPDY